MKNLWTRAALALGLCLVMSSLLLPGQGPQASEAKKLKKVLKELKKLKKYGYLLASQRKKLYAIPFPMPLPIFVKRQHIYTSIPIIPRYIQHPSSSHSSYGSQGASHSSYMASSSSEPAGAASPPPPQVYEQAAMMMGGASSYATPETEMSNSVYAPPKSSSYGFPYKSRGKKQQQTSSMQDQTSYTNAIPSPSKYLSQLASALGAGYSSGSSSNKDILTKILNGQAKVLPPTSLISAIKGPSSALLNLYQQHTSSSSSSSSPSSSGSSSAAGSSSSSTDMEHDSKGESSSGGGGSSSSEDSSHQKSPDSSGSSSSSSSSASDTNKPSASEMHRSRFKPLMIRTPYGRMPMAAANMMQAGMSPAMAPHGMMSPFALMAAHQTPAFNMPRFPMIPPAATMNPLMGASDYMPVVYPQSYPMGTGALTASIPALPDQMEPQSSEINENQADQQMDDQDHQQQQQARLRAALIAQHRRQALLRHALLREREEAARVAEARGRRHVVAPHHLVLNNQLLDRFNRQQQLRLQLQQLHMLQQGRQHQIQQLQQNSIDR